ncbi:hypothetical protein G3A43_08535 [Paraburkholderia aspalathi]|nr:hypothetical protein [Paraburkholderia aspalathi]MBK3780303.1 hypothetical protein [Paraburkholderia aspalathi]
MKHPRLIALLTAVALVASPLTWARSSGFSSSHSSSSFSHSSVSASPSRVSGFGSRTSGFSAAAAPAPTAAPSRPATTGLGSALYSANASKAAANTYASNKAATAALNTRTPQYAANTGSGGNVYNNYHYNSTPAYRPAPLVVHHYHDYDSGWGGHNFLWGYMLGHSSTPQTVVVQQPAQVEYVQPQPQYAQQQYDPQPAAVGTQAGVQPAAPQAASGAWSNAAQSGAADVPVPAQNQSHSHGFLHFLAWVAGIGAVAFLGWKLLSSWSARKSSYTATNHYKL